MNQQAEIQIQTLKPPLKWVGGKTQILGKVLEKFPRMMQNYHEPFIGGGSVLFGLLAEIQKGTIVVYDHIYVSDANAQLIRLYKDIQERPAELCDRLDQIIREYEDSGSRRENGVIILPEVANRHPASLEEAQTSKEAYYYWARQNYNELYLLGQIDLESSAWFLFLNKTCFRGVFRMGPNGFNVPYGNYKNPEIVNRDHIFQISRAIEHVIFTHCDYKMALEQVEDGDFVYMDPPYVPENPTSFVGYTKDGFQANDHIQLFRFCRRMAEQSCNKKWLMSNANMPYLHETFALNIYHFETVECKRSINSKKPGSKTQEVLIWV
jgi:DNA adenine methylase